MDRAVLQELELLMQRFLQGIDILQIVIFQNDHKFIPADPEDRECWKTRQITRQRARMVSSPFS